MIMNNNILEAREIVKQFPGTLALDKADFNLKKGEVHAIIGENGAGKSTLIKIICGAYERTSGKIYLDGKEIEFKNPKEALESGISVIYQEFENISPLTVAENIHMGFLPKNKKMPFFVDWEKLYNNTKSLFISLGLEINPRVLISDLTMAEQQLVEVAKALSRKVKILIMDEPTSSLTKNETEKLFAIIKNLKKEGIGVIYISHRLDEVTYISDRATIFRDGKNIKTIDRGNYNEEEIVRLMIGHSLGEQKKQTIQRDKVVLEIKNLNIYKRVYDVSLEIYKGEVLGLVGLIGSGKDELIKSIYSLWPYQTMELYLDGKRIKIKNPNVAISKGIVYLPEERKIQSLFLEQSVSNNISCIWLSKIFKRFFLSIRKEYKLAIEYITKLSIKVTNLRYKIMTLSGGNQQKIIFARLLAISPKILLLHDPTRGVDVGSKKEIWEIIRQLAKNGCSILLLSSEISEVCILSDRINVISHGKIVEEFKDDEIELERVLTCVMTR